MRRPSFFLRIVADNSTFLFAVEALDRGVGVENLGSQRQGGFRGLVQLPVEPGDACLLIHCFESPSGRVLADHPGHAQQLRVNRVELQRGDVGIPVMTGKD